MVSNRINNRISILTLIWVFLWVAISIFTLYIIPSPIHWMVLFVYLIFIYIVVLFIGNHMIQNIYNEDNDETERV